jgi:hypothetical protein
MESYAAEVIADASGKWSGNALRFATESEARDYVHDLAARWFLVTDTRVIKSADPVSHTFENGSLEAVSK